MIRAALIEFPRKGYAGTTIFGETGRISGCAPEQVANFFGRGMMVATLSTLGELPEVLDYLKMRHDEPR